MFLTSKYCNGQSKFVARDNKNLIAFSFATSLVLYLLMDPFALCLIEKTYLHPIVLFSYGNGIRFHVLFFCSTSISYFITWAHFGFVKAFYIPLGTWHIDKLCANTLRGFDNLWVNAWLAIRYFDFLSSKSDEYRFGGFPQLCLN